MYSMELDYRMKKKMACPLSETFRYINAVIQYGTYVLNLSAAEANIFWESKVSIVAADTLAPFVTSYHDVD